MENKKTINEIKEKLYFISDLIDDIDDATYMIYPNEENGVHFFYNGWHKLSDIEKKKKLEIMPTIKFTSHIKYVVNQMYKLTNNFTFEEKYLHISRDYSEFDEQFSPQYIQLFLRNKKSPYQ